MVVRLKAYKEDEVMAQHRTIWGLEDEVICATGESMLTHRSRRTWQELLKILPGTFLEWTRRCWVATTITAGFPEKKVTCISQGKFPICDSEVGKRRARLTGTHKKKKKKSIDMMFSCYSILAGSVYTMVYWHSCDVPVHSVFYISGSRKC